MEPGRGYMCYLQKHLYRTKVDPLLYGTMVKRWLRVLVYEAESFCPFCDQMMDMYGDHGLICSGGGDRTKRHNLLRNEIYYFCNSIRLNPELEKPGLLQPRPLSEAARDNGAGREDDSMRRPADVYLPRWRKGTPAALDFAVTSGLRGDIVNLSANDGSVAVRNYEDFKCAHLNTKVKCEEEGISFIPVICEADGGGWGPEANNIWSELAKYKSLKTGEKTSIIAIQLLQSLGIILQKENARSILRRLPNSMEDDCIEFLASSADL